MEPFFVQRWRETLPLTALKDTSASKSGNQQRRTFMTQSLLDVINLDNAAKRYARREHSPATPASNDAYYEAASADGWRFFIEFKGGGVDRGNIRDKMEGSLMLCRHMGIFTESGQELERLHYILVYSETKHQRERNFIASRSLNEIFDHVTGTSSSRALTLFGVEEFAGTYCKIAETLTEEEFHKYFVEPMEEADGTRVQSCFGNAD